MAFWFLDAFTPVERPTWIWMNLHRACIMRAFDVVVLEELHIHQVGWVVKVVAADAMYDG